MEYICFVAAMCSSALLSIMSSLFGKKNADVPNTSTFYSALVTAAATATWGVICISDASFDVRAIGYSILYGVFYTLAMIGMFNAYRLGSTSLTAFIKQLSLIGVALWGFLFWNNSLTLNIGIGIALIVVSLYLCFKTDKSTKKSPMTLKWCAYALMLLVGNAGCSIVQKYQQLAFDGASGNAFMFFGVAISFICCAVLYARGEKVELKRIKKASFAFPVIGGISSALLNLFILWLISSTLPESIIFPGIAVGGLIITILFSTVIYREKPSMSQWLGLGIGAVALVLLNL